MNSEMMQYLRSASANRQKRLDVLHSLILELYPDAVVTMRYKMPTYHVGEGWMAIANQKHYVSLYTCSYHHIEKFKKKHPTIHTGKGCIRLKDSEHLPLADLRLVVKHAMEHSKPTT